MKITPHSQYLKSWQANLATKGHSGVAVPKRDSISIVTRYDSQKA